MMHATPLLCSPSVILLMDMETIASSADIQLVRLDVDSFKNVFQLSRAM